MDFQTTEEQLSVDRLIARIRAYLDNLAKRGEKAPRVKLAKLAGINESVIRRIGDADWNPTIETLRKLELAIEQTSESEPSTTIEQPPSDRI